MLPGDTFFSDVEAVMAEAADQDRPRLRHLVDELGRIAERVPPVAERCYRYQARLLARLEEYELALAAVERAVQLMPADESLVVLRGDIHGQAAAFTQALKDYGEVLADHPQAVTARMRRAEIHQARGDHAAALEDIQAALKDEPRSLRLLYRRALILLELRRPLEAAADLRAVARLCPEGELRGKAEERLRELGERYR